MLQVISTQLAYIYIYIFFFFLISISSSFYSWRWLLSFEVCFFENSYEHQTRFCDIVWWLVRIKQDVYFGFSCSFNKAFSLHRYDKKREREIYIYIYTIFKISWRPYCTRLKCAKGTLLHSDESTVQSMQPLKANGFYVWSSHTTKVVAGGVLLLTWLVQDCCTHA